MRLKLTIKCLFIIGLVLGVTGVSSLMSTENYMMRLPMFKRYQCANCHVSTTPNVASYTLNSFGADFKANGEKWDATLAAKDSDGDGYTNGYELGDPDGDGKSDTAFERSNPGNPHDTPNSISVKTWGVIKSLFEN